jgi:8-oxo-dGTP pyrophosphatase MutT (NUDIX family)
MIDIGDRWTGRTATLLQNAMRLSNMAFAARLGISTRTVATWHSYPARVPNSEMQELLSTALQRASESVQRRFMTAMESGSSPTRLPSHDGPAIESDQLSHKLLVAIALVIDDARVLVVKRRGLAGKPDAWQFPAGMVKPGLDSRTVAVRETLAETGVHVEARELLGARVHPDTDVYCEYIACAYLSGEPENRDEAENVAVAWAPLGRLTTFIEESRLYAGLRNALGIAEIDR